MGILRWLSIAFDCYPLPYGLLNGSLIPKEIFIRYFVERGFFSKLSSRLYGQPFRSFYSAENHYDKPKQSRTALLFPTGANDQLKCP